MFQNLFITALTPLSDKTELTSWENQPFRTVWPENSEPKSKDITRTIKKKQKRVRTAFSSEQIRALEWTFFRNKYINSEQRNDLARSLNINQKCVKIWFQNRRMKEKRESSENSCDSSTESPRSESPPVSTSSLSTVESSSDKEPCKTFANPSYQADCAYQLPTYYNSNKPSQNVYGSQPINMSFYNDKNSYPTHYYPNEINYPNVESDNYNNYYSNDMNNFWGVNQNSYVDFN